jgi:hypothetical protein
MAPDNSETVYVRLSLPLKAKLRRLAEARGLQDSPYLRQLIEQQPDPLTKEHHMPAAIANLDVAEVANRLRSTIDEKNAERRAEGVEDGIEWAKEYATADELAKLADGESEGLNPTSESLLAFKSAQLGQDVISVDVDVEEDWPYWDGFMRGAMQVWEAVYHLV